MTTNYKLQIYHGIIQHILDSTCYDLKNIAILSKTPIKNILSIYNKNEIPPNFFMAEKYLIQLYQIIIELKLNKKD